MNKKRNNKQASEFDVAIMKKDFALAVLKKKLFKNVQRGLKKEEFEIGGEEKEEKYKKYIYPYYLREKTEEIRELEKLYGKEIDIKNVEVRLIFTVPEKIQLDIADEDLFLIIQAIYTKNSKRDKVDLNKLTLQEQETIKNEVSAKILPAYTQEKVWSMLQTMTIRTSSYKLLRAMRRSVSMNNIEWLQKSLRRLMNVKFSRIIIYDTDGRKEVIAESSGYLIMYMDTIRTKGNRYAYRIIIHPYLYSVFTSNLHFFSSINLVERFELRRAVEKDLHRHLSVLLSVGEEKEYLLETLVGYLYPTSANKTVNYKNRQNTLEALKEINRKLSYSWQISISKDKKKVKIKHKVNKLYFIIPKMDVSIEETPVIDV
jgi:hypothetical protein